MFGFDENEAVVVDKNSLNLLSEVTEKLDQGKYAEADVQMESVFIQEKIWDVRYLMYYLFSQLAQNKFDTYLQFTKHVQALFTEHYDIISPLQRKEKVIQKAIDWFEKYFPDKFEQTLDLFPNEPELNTICQKTIDMLNTFSSLNFNIEGIQYKMTKLSDKCFTDTNPASTTAESAEIPPANVDSNTDEQTNESHDCQENPDDGTAIDQTYASDKPDINKNDPSTRNHTGTQPPHFSVEWERLLTLLKDYEYYMQKGHKEVAYLAHLRIEEALTNFDPIVYFPKVFENYLRSQMQHYSTLLSFKQQHIESLPYAHFIDSVLAKNDPNLRKMVCEKQFEYVNEAVEDNLANDSYSDDHQSDMFGEDSHHEHLRDDEIFDS